MRKSPRLEYGTVYVPIHNMPTSRYVMYGGHILYRIYLPAIFLTLDSRDYEYEIEYECEF